MSDYSPPLDRLLTFGPVEFNEEWPDYVGLLGLGPEHVPDLIRMVADPELYDSDVEFEGCASIHARRALGQLRAVESVAPLLEAMDEYIDDDDFWTEELSDILARIGPEALPAISSRLVRRVGDQSTRITCASTIGAIGERFPEERGRCVAILTEQLARHEDHEDSWSLNGFIVAALVDLKAKESALAIESAFVEDVVDESIEGGWESVRHELGLGPPPVGPNVRPQWRLMQRPVPLPPPARPKLDKLRKKIKAQKRPSKGNGR